MDLDALRRNSLIHIRADGTLVHDGQPIENPKIIQLFRRGIRVRDDGEAVLHVGSQWCYITADDVVLFVESVRIDAEGGRIGVRLWNDTDDEIAPNSLRLSKDGHLFASLVGRKVMVRFFRSAYHQIAACWEEDRFSPSGYVVRIGNRTWPLTLETD